MPARGTLLLGALALGAAACTVRRPLGPDGPAPRQTIHLESPSAFPIRTTVTAGTPRCLVTALDGTITAIAGDTIRFSEVRALRRVPGSSTCSEPGAPYIVMTEVEQPRTTAVKVSAGRTVLAIIGAGVGVTVAAVVIVICGMEDCF